jgi:putative acetyltransferase
MAKMELRAETPSDHETIYLLTKAAFDPMPFSDGTEADAITALREAGDLALSLVATGDAGIVGQIAFSSVFVDGHRNGWFGLGPVSVWPHLQRTGIGSALVFRW